MRMKTNTLIFFLSLSAELAADPVSPDVATTILTFLSLQYLIRHTYFLLLAWLYL